MARKPEEVEAAIELARAAGVSEALLERMGGYTGCVGVLDTGRPGPVTTLRFDIDCLAIEELCDAYKLDQKTLEATFARYNELLAAGKDADFGRRFDKKAKPIGKAPFYVSEMSPKVHHCMGGMATNVATAVLDVETDQSIPSLFAAGECVGGIHGAVRIGACAVMDCLVNGRQAGLSAAKNKL